MFLTGAHSYGNVFLRPNPCPEGQQWFDGCNDCTCSDFDEICTAQACERHPDCSPGQAYFDGFSWCFCHENPAKDVCKNIDI